MLFQHLSKDQNVAQIQNHDVFSYEVIKNIVHYDLEYSWTMSHQKTLPRAQKVHS